MGMQTFEILRQGIWASLTGGWFYDPHQDVFCNTFHLYIWLLLLCLPFSIYVYFPQTKFLWYVYCGAVSLALLVIKVVNYGLHHMYDTTECIHVEDGEDWQNSKKEEEGIEMQVLSNKSRENSHSAMQSMNLYAETGTIFNTDRDSFESTNELQQLDDTKPGSTIDLKAEVHRKNSMESIDNILPMVEVVPQTTDGASGYEEAKPERRWKHHRSNTDGFVTVSIRDEKPSQSSSFLKLYQQNSSDFQENNLLNNSHQASLQSVDGEQSTSGLKDESNFANYSLTILPEIKGTGSLELGYIDKNLNQALPSEGFYFKPNLRNNSGGVRRIRSTALETTCCPPPSLSVYPNSLELIGCKSDKNPLPPPSNSLVRNQHLNLCPYFGSEIVYPIEEQSDEHQTSHGPDTDLDSLTHMSDSDLETNQGSHSPLIYKTKKLGRNLTFTDKYHKSPRRQRKSVNDESTLQDRSNSSIMLEKHDGRLNFYNTDNETSDKKLSEGSNQSCSNTSVECEDRSDHQYHQHMRRNVKRKSDKWLDHGHEVRLCDPEAEVAGAAALFPPALPGIVRKRNVRKNKKRKLSDESHKRSVKPENCSSLVELDLDWLFEDGDNSKFPHRKDPLTRDLEWSSATTISLEHDVSKVLHEPVPLSTRSLGAIPKKSRNSSSAPSHYGHQSDRRMPKSESEKCSMCRCKSNEQSAKSGFTKENKVTQTRRNSDSPVNGAECMLVASNRQHRPKRGHQSSSGQAKDEASSSGSNTELSTLLPAAPLLTAFLSSRPNFPEPVCLFPKDSLRVLEHTSPHRNRLKRSNKNRRRLMFKRENAITYSLSAGHGTHSAKNFNDTSEGAIHSFNDEHGNWLTYTFDEKGLGTANVRLLCDVPLVQKTPLRRRESDTTTSGAPPLNRTTNQATSTELWDSNSMDSICNSSLSTILDVSVRKSRIHPSQNCANIQAVQVARFRRSLPDHVACRRRRGVSSNHSLDQMNFADDSLISIVRSGDDQPDDSTPGNRFKIIQDANAVNNNFPRTKSYYKYKVLPWICVKVTLDRLKLLALLDRNLTSWETFLAIILGVQISILGATLLYLGFYNDLLAFIFCFVMASCQYSLLKSVQPDAASPTHGFNRVIAYSRPIYFVLVSSLILLLHDNVLPETLAHSYSLTQSLTLQQAILFSRDFLIQFILFFPVFFSLGLFPQVNTFVMYLFEQIDMHLFGGNAMSSLAASFYCIFRSVLAVIVMNGLAYGGLSEVKTSQHILFSMFCACLVACSYHLSRSASDPSHIWNLLKLHLWPPDFYREHELQTQFKPKPHNEAVSTKDSSKKPSEKNVQFTPESHETKNNEHVDPLPRKLHKTINGRLKNDVISCALIALLVFGIHASTIFTVLQPELSPILWCIVACVGFVLHYIIPQLRKQLPWLCIARPVLRSHEHELYQIRGPAKIMWFERVYVYLCFVERNVLYPLLFLSVLTEDAPKVALTHGPIVGSFIVVTCGLKCMRNSYSDQNSQYLILTFAVLLFQYNYDFMGMPFLIQYFMMSVVYQKFYELLLKVQFVVTYIAPWQITWGSAFHAFAQPFSIPHSAMLFLQALISAVLSTPLNPFLGSAIFLTSYVRPVKFWERDYKTRRVDHSNTPLSSHLDRNLGADDNNLNSIFYEHLTRSLQHSLCGDLAMGRWGPVNQGDCFVLASDYLNCLVHLIEIGNGLVTFQMRGLEFRGTYCQQREVEAITEGVEENDGCCCCDTGHLPNMLSVNAAFSQRWLSWEVTAAKYILKGYSISDNSAVSMLQVFEFRKVLVSYYVKSIIFYAIRSPKLEEWLTSKSILKALQPMDQRGYVDLDPVFNSNIDEDYDTQSSGMTKNMFVQIHGDWITYCAERREKSLETDLNSILVLLCFALSLLGRRTLGAVSHNTVSNVEFFLYGLHALFKGDFRITCPRDEWVFTDIDLLKSVVAPGVRMSLKLHQDHFMSPEEYEDQVALYDAICKHEEDLVISHEGDPAWRSAVLSDTSSLLALRHVLDDGQDEYKIIMLNKRYLSFRVIKINKECVRGLWAGQQQELVYLRNRNPERGSIQNAKQALRNIINSSCDQPIGYPIYVSPLTTSYAETNEQYRSLVGGSITIKKIKFYAFNLFRRIRKRCGEGCSSGVSNHEDIGMGHEGIYAMNTINSINQHTAGSQSMDGSHLGGSMGRGSSLSRSSLGGNRGSLVSVGKPTSSTLASLAGLFKEKDERNAAQATDVQTNKGEERLGNITNSDQESIASRVRIIDPNFIYDGINLGRRIDVSWPTEYMRLRGGRSHWKDWVPEVGMEGSVVHKWTPCNKDLKKRSHVDRIILLVQIDDKYVPIAENGVQDLGSEM